MLRKVNLTTIIILVASCAPTAQLPEEIEPAPSLFLEDTSYASDDSVTAERFGLQAKINQQLIGGFAQLSDQQKQHLAKLQKQSLLKFEVNGYAGRLLVDFPVIHPLSKAQLLIDEEMDTIFVFMTEKKIRYLLPRDRLPDIFDCAQPSSRSDFTLIYDDESPLPSEQQLHQKHKLAVRQAVGNVFYSRVRQNKGWPLKYSLRLTTDDSILKPLGRYPLWSLILPWFETEHGRTLLAEFDDRLGTPAQWSLTVTNEAQPTAAPFMQKNRLQNWGTHNLPRSNFSFVRNGYRDSKVFDECASAGRQIWPESALALLREAKNEGPLVINNRFTMPLLIYVDGLYLGWIGAEREFSFAGLPAGFYRLYATTFTGARAFGPFDLYVPGPVTLK